MVDVEAPKSSQEPSKSPPRAPKRSPREPQNAFKTIFGSKTLTFQKCQEFYRKIKVFEVGRSIWELKIDFKRFRKEIKNDIERRR